jgi:heme exporter protein A
LPLTQTSNPATAELEAVALTCERGDRRLFEGLSLAVSAGDSVQIAGPNGCGKTTLLRILCGLVLPVDGTVNWRGQPLDDVRADLHSHLCYLGYAGGVKLELTPRENLQFAAALHASDVRSNIDSILERVDLYGFEDDPGYTLSAGQRRRVSLARLLFTAAPLWILDEPLTALDTHGTELAERLLSEHVEAGGILIFTTHQPLERVPPGTRTLRLG